MPRAANSRVSLDRTSYGMPCGVHVWNLLKGWCATRWGFWKRGESCVWSVLFCLVLAHPCRDTNWWQNDYLPNLYSRRIISGDCLCRLCMTKYSRGIHIELPSENYLAEILCDLVWVTLASANVVWIFLEDWAAHSWFQRLGRRCFSLLCSLFQEALRTKIANAIVTPGCWKRLRDDDSPERCLPSTSLGGPCWDYKMWFPWLALIDPCVRFWKKSIASVQEESWINARVRALGTVLNWEHQVSRFVCVGDCDFSLLLSNNSHDFKASSLGDLVFRGTYGSVWPNFDRALPNPDLFCGWKAPRMGHLTESLAIFHCDGKTLAIAMRFVIFFSSPLRFRRRRGCLRQKDVMIAIAIFGALRYWRPKFQDVLWECLYLAFFGHGACWMNEGWGAIFRLLLQHEV